MPVWLLLLVSSALAWVVGSIPFSLLIAKWIGGIDLRQHGSGNVGATNVARTVGAKWGFAALVFDAIKGILPVVILPMIFRVPVDAVTHQQVLCGVAAILGHMFPPWLGFRGGKGVATSLGVVSVLGPWATLIAFGVFVICFAASRIVSLSSMLAAIGFATGQFGIHGSNLWKANSWSLGLFSVAVPAMIIFRHRENLRRIWRGEEKALTFGAKSVKDDAVPAADQHETDSHPANVNR